MAKTKITLPDDRQIREYSATHILAQLKKHDENIKIFSEQIEKEKTSKVLLHAILARKDELEKAAKATDSG